MDRLVIAAGLVAIIVVVALLLRRTAPEPPTQKAWSVPAQLDREDFPDHSEEWLVVVFSSATCATCASVLDKAAVLASGAVGVAEAEYVAQRALHDRYRIDAVPTVVVADGEGVVRASFVGPVTATDLWATVAELREPGVLDGVDCDHGVVEPGGQDAGPAERS
ncbi:MAG: hypothetical protein JJU45_14375 [Acidimicrobiia bacterium]|nr:hypothetical protein [Acidimicrobiia bacterium]